MGPSIGTKSKAAFWPTVIITCCNLAFGPRLTSQTLLPATLAASRAASYSAHAAHGSSTAGNTISFFSPGPFGPLTGSRVCSGSGAIPAQTTICNACAIKPFLAVKWCADSRR
jgi:hypothetical protein